MLLHKRYLGLVTVEYARVLGPMSSHKDWDAKVNFGSIPLYRFNDELASHGIADELAQTQAKSSSLARLELTKVLERLEDVFFDAVRSDPNSLVFDKHYHLVVQIGFPPLLW